MQPKGAKHAITLQVSAPFHCMLESAGKKLALELEKQVHKMSLPVVANVNAQYGR